jgi:putative nucleotidyltransferase with HDIG domain
MDKIEFDDSKYDLKSLLDAKHPFLEKMRERAPGTYKHSQNVASLCESVALELDIDQNMMRVLGMYHDAGKVTFPECFYENQNGSGNMHDKLNPIVSFHLISKHVSDSALILVQLEDFPNELIEPITQHHGNTVLKSLALKADGVEEDFFRYKNTCPPTTLEAAILMICDSIDAIIRSKESNDKIDIDDIREIIRNTIERLEGDDQLDEIRVGDLKKIKKALQRDLESKYHKRSAADYEEDDDKKVKDLKK